MAFRAYRSDRRLRRRRWLLIVVSLIAVISMIAYLASRQTERRGTVEFFAAADEASDSYVRASAELNVALASIGIIERQDLERRLQNVTDAAAEAESLLDLDVPSTIGESYGTMTAAAASWADGIADVNMTIMAIMDGVLVEGATDLLQAALDLLRVGDVSYSLFLATLETVPDGIDVSAFSPVMLINPDVQDPLLYDAQSLVLRIQTSYDLSPHHDVAVNGMIVPEPVGESGGIPVVPFAASLEVAAVVTNLGNQDEAVVDVVLDVFSIDTGETLTDSERLIDLLAGASTTVTFSDVGIEPGGLYQVTVAVTIADDIGPDNDVWDITFIWRDES
ncbi:MAG: hypothetical protein BMS9Abin12_1416 [Acidimicrobiia bacterium]|nr:MAG: hypothetical protein BMS9Abin12_1416 [Acidimicrobiia bacterium]